MECVNCEYCRFPRSSNENNGNCKCKIMKYKTIDVYVSGGQPPEWCPIKEKKETPTKIRGAIVKRKCDKCESGFSIPRKDLTGRPFLCDDCYDKEFKEALGLSKFNSEMNEILNKLSNQTEC